MTYFDQSPMQPTQGMVDPTTLVQNPWNTNVMSPDQEAKLEESIARFGMFKPVVVRTLSDGRLQILGGAHRAEIAQRKRLPKIPVINLGTVDDKKAKEISLIDNGRYGQDDAIRLAELLGELGNPNDLATFMPYSELELDSLFSSVNVALDDLTLSDSDEELPELPTTKAVQTHQVMRFKIPVEDAEAVQALIEKTMKTHGFSESDALTNAGDALVHILLGNKD